MISILLIIMFVISISCVSSNHTQYKKIKRTYNILKHNNVLIIDNKNGTFTVESLGSKCMFYRHGRLYTVKLFDSHQDFLINNWTTYFDPYSLFYLLLINKLFNKLKTKQNV